MMQQMDIVRCGIPPRTELDAMQAAPSTTDVPPRWIASLARARRELDEAEDLADESKRRATLIDRAMDIEQRAIAAFLRALR